MKFIFAIAFVFTFFSTEVHSQAVTCLGNDITVCQGQNVTINHCPNSNPNSANIILNNPSSVSLTDDNWSGVINIGFPVSFYGNTYTQCIIGSNGIVSFELANANGPCAWTLNATPLPTTTITTAFNTAMMCYQDLNPANANSGPVQYQTIGTAPNRKFVVLYNAVTMFSCTNSCAYIGMVFHEGSNIIDYYIGYKGSCPTWNNGRAIQGVENNNGTVAHITTGRNNSAWTVSQDAKRFTPTAPSSTTNYTISTIPYQTIVSNGGAVQWKNTFGQVFPYNNGVLVVNQVPPGTTGYFLVGSACGNPIGTVSDTTYVTRTNASVSASSNASICGTPTGSATATPISGTPPFLFNWPAVNQTSQTAINLPAGTYVVVMTDANGCVATTSTTVQNNAAEFYADSTEVSCAGGSDGTATAFMSPTGTVTTYLWNDSQNQITQTATGLNVGIYTCTIISDNGCIGSVSVEVTQIPELLISIINKSDVTCHSKNDGQLEVNAIQGKSPYSYSWSGSSSTSNTAIDLFAGPQNITVTDVNGCSATISTLMIEPDALQLTFLSPDTMICSESAITLSAAGIGGSTAYTYSWFENSALIGTGTSILVNPLNSGTVYTVEMTEVCGSPPSLDSMNITFPTEIDPLIGPDKTQGCAPENFYFVNESSNSGDISTIFYEISNDDQFLVTAYDTIKSYFSEPGSYDVNVTITSIYGCIYQKSFPAIITALERPKARFLPSANPSTIFETKIAMEDKSVGAVKWEWEALQASPSTGNASVFSTEFPSLEGNYPVTLKVTSLDGCSDSTSVIIEIQPDLIFYTPNAFTPDGDQFNQTWKFHSGGIDLHEFQLDIFDRWGNLLWSTNDPKAEWDGTANGQILPQGMYMYVVKMQERTKENPRIQSGSINLIR